MADGTATATAPALSWTKENEHDFLESLAIVERRRLLWAFGIGALLMPVSILQDAKVYPAYLPTLIVARLTVSGIILVLLLGIYLFRGYAKLTIATFIGLLVSGGAIALMGHLVHDQKTPYFAAVVIVQVFGAVFCTMPVWSVILVNALLIAIYVLPLLRYPTIDSAAFAFNLNLLMSGGFVSVVATLLRLKLARQEFQSRLALSQSNIELQSLHKMKDQMFQNVSHEFRTPLTLIIAPLERFLSTPGRLDEELRVGLESVRRSALRLLNLINDLLDLARLGSQEASVEVLPEVAEDVGALLQRIGQDVKPLADAKGVAFTLKLPATAPIYRTAARPLEKIVLNLISNALKFTPAGGQVTLSAVEGKDGLTVSVQDSGIGIPPEAHARVFERFRQVDGSTTRRYGGTGIGLTLVAELAKLLGARLSLDSAPGRGSTFSVQLPATKRESDASLVSHSEAVEPTLEFARQAAYAALAPEVSHKGVRRAGDRGPRLLLAEDDPQLNNELVQLLAPHYRVRSVSDGLKAMEEAQNEFPEVIVSDVMMPGMDGVTLAKTLRQNSALRETAIVLLSARASLEDRIRGREAGVDTYLTKPFNPRELLATVEGLLRSRMRLVGNYLLGKRLGQGGQCEVYLAEHLQTGAPAAVKILSWRRAEGDEAKTLLSNEQQALARLTHPNIVRILEQGQQESRSYMAMEHLQGASLKEICAGRPRFGAVRAAAVGRALSGALSAVHEIGLIHRDVKLDNVMILNDGPSLEARVRLIDFGIVLDANSPEARQVTDGQPIGTVSYLAPEILRGGSASPASDLYALGVCLYFLACGQHPFSRELRADTMAAILAGQPTPLDQLAPESPPALLEVVERALQSDPAERWPSADAMGALLAKISPNSEPGGPTQLTGEETQPTTGAHKNISGA